MIRKTLSFPIVPLKNEQYQLFYFDDDMYVYGSDEIWNFQSSIFNIESHFFGLNNKKEKIAYAVSIGNAKDFKKIDDNVIKSLKSFKSISVRDNNTFEFVKNLIGVNPKIVCDPSFLVEIPAQYIKLNLYQNIEYALVYGRYFSNKEITLALDNNYIPVTLGSTRLRTETAAIVACHSIVFINE